MYKFIVNKIDSKFLEELRRPVIWNTVLKEYKTALKTQKPVVLITNNLPGKFDKEIIEGLAHCMNYKFDEGILWSSRFEDILVLLEKALNEEKTYITFCTEKSLLKFEEKPYFAEFFLSQRMEFSEKELEGLIRHFTQNSVTLNKQKFTIGELFLALCLSTILRNEPKFIARLVKNVQYEYIGKVPIMVPRKGFLIRCVFDSPKKDILSLFGIEAPLMDYFLFYEAILRTSRAKALPHLSRDLIVNMVISGYFSDEIGDRLDTETVKKLTKFYDLDYHEKLLNIVKLIENATSEYSYRHADIRIAFSNLIQKKLESISYLIHGLEYEFKMEETLEKLLTWKGFHEVHRMDALDPIFVRFSNFKFKSDVLLAILKSQIKQIKDSGVELNESLFAKKRVRNNNDTKLLSILGNVMLFKILEQIYGFNMLSDYIENEFLRFLSKIGIFFFSLDNALLRDFKKRVDERKIDEFLEKVISHLSEIIEGTTFVNSLTELKKDERLTKFIEEYQQRIVEFRERDEPTNPRMWTAVSFFYDYLTDQLIDSYSCRNHRNITKILDEVIEYAEREGFDHTILLVVDGLSYVHWQLIKPDLLKNVKGIAKLTNDEFRFGTILSRTPVGHSALFSGLPPFENGGYSDILRFEDSKINLMEGKWYGDLMHGYSIHPNYEKNIRIIKNKTLQGLFRSRHGKDKFYFFATDLESIMTILFQNLLGTEALSPQKGLTKRLDAVKGELNRLTERDIEKFANSIYQLKDKTLEGHISVIQYPDLDRVMHRSGWNFHFFLETVKRQLTRIVRFVKENLKGKILIVITSDHGSISMSETRAIMRSLPSKFTMKDFDSLETRIPNFDKDVNRFSYSYIQLFDDSQVAAVSKYLRENSRNLKEVKDEKLIQVMGRPNLKGLIYPKAFLVPKYLMHFSPASVLRHGGCSLNELLIPLVFMEVGR